MSIQLDKQTTIFNNYPLFHLRIKRLIKKSIRFLLIDISEIRTDLVSTIVTSK